MPQRTVGIRRTRDHKQSLRRPCNAAGSPPRDDSTAPPRVIYLVRVRGTHAPRDWATYIGAVREGTLLSKAEFARRIGVDRGTINRWENGQTKPTDVAILMRLARTFQLDLDDVFGAAGFRPEAEVEAPAPERDEEAEEIMASNLPPSIKRELLQVLAEERERDKQRRLEQMRRLIAAQRRRAS